MGRVEISSRSSGTRRAAGKRWVELALAVLETWAERRRQRRALLELNDALLKDIGLGRADAWHEASKPFWRA